MKIREKLSKEKIKKMKLEQNNRCYYCNIEFDYNNKYLRPTVEHLQPFCQVWENTKKVLSCARCNHLKGDIPLELYLDWYICVNYKYTYNWQSENKPVKVRKPINWFQYHFPSIFWWSKYKKDYKTTVRLYDL